MKRVRVATGSCFAGVVAALALAVATPGRAEDGGTSAAEAKPVTCRLKEDVCPSVGHGCHIKWEERMEDGSWVDAMAPVSCNRSLTVCGREIWCTCPTPGHPNRCVHASHE